MHVIEGHDNLGGKEESGGYVESLRGAEVRKQLSSWNVLEKHVEKAIVVIRPDPWGREGRGGEGRPGGMGRERGEEKRVGGRRGGEEGGGGSVGKHEG